MKQLRLNDLVQKPFVRRMLTVGLGFQLMCVASGCHKPGLQRTSFDDWEVRELPRLGARVEVPVDFYFGGWDYQTDVSFSMHPVWPPRHLLVAEPQCILVVKLARKNLEEFEQEYQWVVEAGEEKDEEFRRLWKWDYSRHEVVDRFVDEQQIIYRYDLGCTDGTLLVMSAVLQKVKANNKSEYIEKDDAAIRRILSSVECIDQAPMPSPAGTAIPGDSP